MDTSRRSPLSARDVEELLRDPSAETRKATVEKLAAQFAASGFTGVEMATAVEIIRSLAKDVEMRVREALSLSLAASPLLPRDIALQLARDIDSVALPILQYSQVFTDEDLKNIILMQNEKKQQAIARRSGLSAGVIDHLIEHARSERVMSTLGGNNDATMTEAQMERALTRFPGSTEVADSLAKRTLLPLPIAEKLVFLVSNQLRNHIVAHYDIAPAIASDLLIEARERATIRMAVTADEDITPMLEAMHRENRLTTTLLMRALLVGDLALFEQALAIRSGLTIINTRALIHDRGRLGLESICKKADIPPRFIPAIRAAIAAVDEIELDGQAFDLERHRRRVIERLLTQANVLNAEDSDYLIDKLRRLTV
ncbi:MAG TPA: DUF2336 domain-containing protein [Dongiaceae bacterium]|jgi:uncharacterized protein (DUF2336 family)|nr:DUF2336 domain-containing protein [Dongiaceae bacterium]